MAEAQRRPEDQPAPARDQPVVPVVDRQPGGEILPEGLLLWFGAGALVGGLLLGLLAYLVAAGPLAVTGLGQLAASGLAPATFVGAGVGVALGALVGGILALARTPPRRP